MEAMRGRARQGAVVVRGGRRGVQEEASQEDVYTCKTPTPGWSRQQAAGRRREIHWGCTLKAGSEAYCLWTKADMARGVKGPLTLCPSLTWEL